MVLRFLKWKGYLQQKLSCFITGLRALLRDDSGMGTLEIIIIIAVLVALALVFRNFIMDMAGMIFDKIKAKTDATINTL